MTDIHVRKIEFGGKNLLKAKSFMLDKDISCIILISTKDEKLEELFYNKIVDSIIDRIHPKNIYKDFSGALENINAFLSNWKGNDDKIKSLHGFVGIQFKKTLYFSTIGKASCYLHNSHSDIIEVTDKSEYPKDFSFISSGDIAGGESIVISNIRILDTLSKDDLIESFELGNVERTLDGLEGVLLREHEGKNIALTIVKCENIAAEGSSKNILANMNYLLLRCMDNRIVKKGFGRLYQFRDYFISRNLQTKQFLLAGGILVSTYLLYTIVSGFFYVTTSTGNTQQAQQDLLAAQELIVTASENMNDSDIFSFNIQEAQNRITQVESEELFLGDVAKLKGNISILQKKFNGIESFETNSENTFVTFDSPQESVKIVDLAGKIYLVNQRSVRGPIFSDDRGEEYIFDKALNGDTFLDATVYGSDIIITTNSGRVVSFTSNNTFRYVDVQNQASWEKSPIVDSYASNLYLLSDSGNQILRHKKVGSDYDAGVSYLTDEDALSTGRILSLAIDGGIYILKLDGSMLKLFRSPKYRLESIVLNKLPKNYDFSNIDANNIPSLQTKANLKYVYLLLNNKIMIFKPNTIRYQDVKSLDYIGQIEGKDITINSYYVKNDGEIIVAGNSGVYKLGFEVNDEKIILK